MEEPIYIHPDGEFRVYVRNGWPIVEKRSDVFEIPGNHKFRSLEDAVRWVDEQSEPEFKVIAVSEGVKRGRVYSLNHYLQKDRVRASPFLPVSPEATRRGPSEKVFPGIGNVTANIEMKSVYLFENEKKLEFLKYVLHADGVTYFNVPYLEGIATLRVPWDEFDSIIARMSIKDVPRKYVEKYIDLPFSEELRNQIKHIYYAGAIIAHFYAFTGRTENITWGIFLMDYNGKREWRLIYTEENVVKYFNDVYWRDGKEISDPEVLKEVADIHELIDFVVF